MDGQVVEGMDFENRRLVVTHRNVTIRNSRIRTPAAVKVLFEDGGSGCVENCDIAGVSDVDGGVGVGNGRYTARGNYVHRVMDAFRLGPETVVEGNLTDDQSVGVLNEGTGELLHTDGVQSTGCANPDGRGSVVRGNTLRAVRLSGKPGNSALIIGCEEKDVAHVLVEGNYVEGGNYTFMLKGDQGSTKVEDVLVRANTFGGGARFGDLQWKPSAGYVLNGGGGVRKDGSPLQTAEYLLSPHPSRRASSARRAL